jgi:catechol 2,3-dioxygenase-like lactoylglutathione lyase family enzyme
VSILNSEFSRRLGLKDEMKVTEGITWILVPTPRFQESLAFFRDVMGLPVAEEGVPVTDTQFDRYAQIKLPNGVVLEIVEPKETAAQLYHAPVVSITVDDVARARKELEERQVKFVAPIFDTGKGWGWTYFQAPDGAVYQLQGPLQRTSK